MALDLALTESEEMLRKTALDFLRRDSPKEVVQALQETDTGCTEELWQKVAEMGWLGIIIPEQYGGTGQSLTSAGTLFEALGTAPLPGPYFSSGILGSSIVLAAGNQEQKERILPAVAEGRQILALAFTETGASWEPGEVQAKAESRNGDFVLNGVKLFTIDAQAATHLIVVARTGEGADPAKELSLFLVDRESDGVAVRRLPGFLAGRTFEVKLDSVKVSQSALLGEKGEGWQPLTDGIARSIPVLCAYKVGGCQAVLDMTLEYSRTRVQFGQPIGRFQRVQDMILEMFDHEEAARWTTYECLWKLDTGMPADESIHLAKAVSSQAYWEVCTLAHRVFSGVSYSTEHPASFHTKASRHLFHYLGDPAHHRQQIAQLVIAS